MANFRFVFQQVGDCLEFVDLVIRNLSRLGLNRNQLRAEVGDSNPPNFAVLIYDALSSVGPSLLAMARCSDYQASTASEHRGKSINEFLAGIALTRPSRSPSGHPLAVLLFEAGKAEFRACYASVLDLGCRGIHVGVMPAAQNHGLSHLILIDSPPATFWPPAEWAAKDRGRWRAVACYRLRPDEGCRLYVEWNCEYPYRNIEQLYDFEDPRCHSVFALTRDVFAMARDEDDLHAKAPWIRLLQQDYEPLFMVPEHRVKAGFDPHTVTIDLQPADLGQQVEFDFEVRSQARSVTASPEALEQKITYHSQAIVDLRRDHHSATEIRRKPIYLAHLFYQALGGGDEPPPPLSRPFARFLDQPFSQLKEMEYGFYETQAEDGMRQGLHVVFDSRPQSHVQLLTSLADETYVQQAQWHDRDWNLPLYIRRGEDVRPRIDDQRIANEVRNLLWRDQSASDPILLRSRPSGDGGEPWELLRVSGKSKLTDCFAFLNNRFATAVLEFRDQVPAALAARVEAVQQPLADHGTELVDQLVEAAESLIQAAAAEWDKLHERIKMVRDQCAEHADAVTAVQTAIEHFPNRWLDFVKDVLEVDRLLFTKKITAARKYAAAKTELAKATEDRELVLLNARQQVEADQQAIKERQRLYEHTVDDVKRTTAQFRETVGEFGQRQHVVQQQLEARHEAAKTRGSEVHTQLQQAKREEDRLGNELKKLELELENLRKTQESIEKLLKEARRLRDNLREEKNRQLEKQTELEQLRQEIDSLRSEVGDLESRNQAARPLLEKERSALVTRKAQAEDDLARRQREVEEARNLLADLAEKSRAMDEDLARLKQEGQSAEQGRKLAEEQLRETTQEKEKRDRELEELRREREKLEAGRKQLAKRKKEYADAIADLQAERQALDAAEVQTQQEHLRQVDEFHRRLKVFHRRRAALQSLLNMAESLAGDLSGTPAAEEEVSQPSELAICETTHAELLKQIRQHLLPPKRPPETPLDQRGANL